MLKVRHLPHLGSQPLVVVAPEALHNTGTNDIRRRRSKTGFSWHQAERLQIQSQTDWLWRGVAEDGNVLDMRNATSSQEQKSCSTFEQKTALGKRLGPTGDGDG